MLTAHEIKTAVSRYWSGRAAGFDLAPSHNVLTEAQHQAWLDLLREVAGPSARTYTFKLEHPRPAWSSCSMVW